MATNRPPVIPSPNDVSGKLRYPTSKPTPGFVARAEALSHGITFERDRPRCQNLIISRCEAGRPLPSTTMRMTGCSRVFLRARGLHRTGRPVSPRDSSALGLSAGDSVGEPNFSEGGTQDPVRGVNEAITPYLIKKITRYEPPKFIWRTLYTFLLLGLVIKRVLWHRKLNMQQTLQQIGRVGPDTLGVAMLTSSFVGMVFTIQFCKEFSKVGLTRVIWGLLGLAFTRELTPVICAIVLAGRVGSAIAAELGTMQVSEQVDQLRTLGSDPVDYLVAPRVVACAVSLPILSVISFTVGMASSILLADLRYGISPNAIVDSAAKYLESFDIGVMCAKGFAFGGVISVISCGWGQTTTGGAKGVGESTTASVVISLVAIFVVDFFLSMFFFKK